MDFSLIGHRVTGAGVKKGKKGVGVKKSGLN